MKGKFWSTPKMGRLRANRGDWLNLKKVYMINISGMCKPYYKILEV